MAPDESVHKADARRCLDTFRVIHAGVAARFNHPQRRFAARKQLLAAFVADAAGRKIVGGGGGRRKHDERCNE